MGYPERYKHHEFVERYGAVGGGATAEGIVGSMCDSIGGGRFEEEGERRTHQRYGFQVGLTKVFMSGKAYEAAERMRDAALGLRATAVQRVWRGSRVRKEYRRTLRAIVLAQGAARRWKAQVETGRRR